MTEQLNRLRLTVDVIHTGTRLSPTAMRRVAEETSTHVHVLGLQDIKNVEVAYRPMDDRVLYAHYHDSSNGRYCDNGCLPQAQDGYNQSDLESD